MPLMTPQKDTWAARLAAFQRGYMHVVAALAATMMASTLVITLVQVFCRYLLDSSLIWAEEMCRYFLIWMCFLFVGAAFMRGEVVALDTLTSRLSPAARAMVMIPGYLLTAAFLLTLTYYGFLYASQNSRQTIAALDFIWLALAGRESGISVFWIYISAPVGCAIFAFHILFSAARMALPAAEPDRKAG